MAMSADLLAIMIAVALLASVGSAVVRFRWQNGTYLPQGATLADISLASTSLRDTTWTLVATSLGGAITIGFIGLVYRSGTLIFAAGVAFLVGLYILWLLVPRIRKLAHDSSAATIETFIAPSSPALRLLVTLVNMFAFLSLLLAQFIALRSLLEAFAGPYASTLMIATLVTLFIYVSYGYRGVLFTEEVQGWMIFLWIGVVAWTLLWDWRVFVTDVPDLGLGYLSGLELGPIVLIFILFVFPWTTVSRADLWQRIVSAQSDTVARRSLVWLALVMGFVYVLMTLAGLYLRAKYPGAQSDTVAYNLLNGYSLPMKAVAVLGIFAALISTADSFLNIFGTSMAGAIERYWRAWSGMGVLSAYVTVVALSLAAAWFLVYSNLNLGDVIILASTAFAVIAPAFLARILEIPVPSSVGVFALLVGGAVIAGMYYVSRSAEIAGAVGGIAAFVVYGILVLYRSMGRRRAH